MVSPLATPMGNLLAKIKEAVGKRSDAKLAEIKESLESLSVRLDEIAVVEAAKWKRLEDEVFSIPITDKSYSTDGIEAHRRRMMLAGRFKTLIDKCLGTISVAKEQIEFEKKLQDANFNPATMSSLREDVSKVQMRLNEWKEQMEEGLNLESVFGAVDTQMATDAVSESERKAQEFWDLYDTCMAFDDGKKKKNCAMGILDRIKNALGVDKARGNGRKAAAIPSLEEIHDHIIAMELFIKKYLEKVVKLETSREVLVEEALAGASAVARSKLLIRQKELVRDIKLQVAMVKNVAKNLDLLLDAELFMRIKESFSRSGFECHGGEKEIDLESVQNVFDELSSRLVVLSAQAESFATLQEPSTDFASEAQTMPAAPDED